MTQRPLPKINSTDPKVRQEQRAERRADRQRQAAERAQNRKK